MLKIIEAVVVSLLINAVFFFLALKAGSCVPVDATWIGETDGLSFGCPRGHINDLATGAAGAGLG